MYYSCHLWTRQTAGELNDDEGQVNHRNGVSMLFGPVQILCDLDARKYEIIHL